MGGLKNIEGRGQKEGYLPKMKTFWVNILLFQGYDCYRGCIRKFKSAVHEPQPHWRNRNMPLAK